MLFWTVSEVFYNIKSQKMLSFSHNIHLHHNIFQWFSKDSSDASVSLNPCFPRGRSALLSQTAQSVVIRLPLTPCTETNGHYHNWIISGGFRSSAFPHTLKPVTKASILPYQSELESNGETLEELVIQHQPPSQVRLEKFVCHWYTTPFDVHHEVLEL